MTGELQHEASPGEIGRHLRAVVHDLNNPLAVMMGFTQLMLMDGRCEGQSRVDLEKVHSEIKRVAAVVERLHAYALSLQRRGQETPADSGCGLTDGTFPD